MARVKAMASSGTKGKAARVPSALAMARLLRDGVGEKGRRAWPPRRSSRERMVARRWDASDMVSGFLRRLHGECSGGDAVLTSGTDPEIR